MTWKIEVHLGPEQSAGDLLLPKREGIIVCDWLEASSCLVKCEIENKSQS